MCLWFQASLIDRGYFYKWIAPYSNFLNPDSAADCSMLAVAQTNIYSVIILVVFNYPDTIHIQYPLDGVRFPSSLVAEGSALLCVMLLSFNSLYLPTILLLSRYHFLPIKAIVYILTACDAGTPSARFMLPDLLRFSLPQVEVRISIASELITTSLSLNFTSSLYQWPLSPLKSSRRRYLILATISYLS